MKGVKEVGLFVSTSCGK